MAATNRAANSEDRAGWTPARLIPTAGIKGEEERERRATSSLLAVIHAVPEFGHALLKELGAPKSPTIETFTEVRFKTAAGKTWIPDGAIVCQRGQKSWTALVEVKTGASQLKDDQVCTYLEIARENGFDGVLTISNEITYDSSQSPVAVDRRKLRSTSLWHFSWWRIITEAVVQHRHRGVSDPDQAWVLGELIAYLDSQASGAGGFEDMGPNWVAVRSGAHDGTLRQADAEVRDVAQRWEQFTEYLCLGLSQDLGRKVFSPRPRKQNSDGRREELAKALASEGRLDATLRVPDAVGDIAIRADLRSKRALTTVLVDAPREGRAKGRISWLLRQLGDSSADLIIDVFYPSARHPVSATLGQARDDQARLLYPSDLQREPRSFAVTLARPIGSKRGRGEGSFISETRQQAFDFYRDFVQVIKPWQARAPKLPDEPDAAAVPRSPSPTPPPFVAAQQREVGAAVEHVVDES